jgi:hypothetical protein
LRTHAITPDALAARLAPLGEDGYCTRMAVAILLTPDDHGGLVADAAADYVLVGDSVPALVDWSGLLLALGVGAVGVDSRTTQLLRLATALALDQR